jgi:DNA repair protein RecO (recombination protein O)
MTYQVKGIILKKQDYRESDRLFIIYTDELGKIEAVAKGVKKIKSKMAGHLDLFFEIDFMVALGKTYYQIAGADIRKNFNNMKKDLAKTVLGSFCLEIVDNFVKPGHPDYKIYRLLREFLNVLNNSDKKNFLENYALLKFFIIKLMSLLGWEPELYNCLKCKNKIMPNGNFFDAGRGGLVCGKCGRDGFPISAAGIKILRFVLKKESGDFTAIKISKKQLKETSAIIDYFMKAHGDSKPKSGLWINYLTQVLKF